MLLTALAAGAGARGRGPGALLVDLEGHGREELFEGVDLSRTVGWFTTLFPVRLEVRRGGRAGAMLQVGEGAAAGACRGRGLGYGVLRYLRAATWTCGGELRARRERR